ERLESIGLEPERAMAGGLERNKQPDTSEGYATNEHGRPASLVRPDGPAFRVYTRQPFPPDGSGSEQPTLEHRDLDCDSFVRRVVLLRWRKRAYRIRQTERRRNDPFRHFGRNGH